uniref:Uncharacterized protein n=1 Tax=Meloidogyne enterolobii TaxID=390850 RepID=A0A6V7VZA9_MELEN|nr:unnamed protein product [Meloidogyne enterolobii]
MIQMDKFNVFIIIIIFFMVVICKASPPQCCSTGTCCQEIPLVVPCNVVHRLNFLQQ